MAVTPRFDATRHPLSLQNRSTPGTPARRLSNGPLLSRACREAVRPRWLTPFGREVRTTTLHLLCNGRGPSRARGCSSRPPLPPAPRRTLTGSCTCSQSRLRPTADADDNYAQDHHAGAADRAATRREPHHLTVSGPPSGCATPLAAVPLAEREHLVQERSRTRTLRAAASSLRLARRLRSTWPLGRHQEEEARAWRGPLSQRADSHSHCPLGSPSVHRSQEEATRPSHESAQAGPKGRAASGGALSLPSDACLPAASAVRWRARAAGRKRADR